VNKAFRNAVRLTFKSAIVSLTKCEDPKKLNPAPALLRFQFTNLRFPGINESVLYFLSFGEFGIQRALVIVAAPLHFGNELSVAKVKGGELSPPPQGLRMPGIAFLIMHEDAPDCVELPVFAQKMLPA